MADQESQGGGQPPAPYGAGQGSVGSSPTEPAPTSYDTEQGLVPGGTRQEVSGGAASPVMPQAASTVESGGGGGGNEGGTVVVPPVSGRGLPILPVILGLILVLGLAFLGGWLWLRFKGEGGGTAGEVKLTYWGLWEEAGIIEPLLVEFNQAHPGVTVVYERQSKEDYRERLQSVLAKGTGPDIFRFHNTWLPMFKEELAPVPASVMSASEFEAAFYPAVKNDLRMGANYYGIPLEIEGLGLYVNDEIFRAAGKTSPVTWDELRKTAAELTVRDKQGKIKVAGVALGNTVNVDNWPDILGLMMLQNGVDLTAPTGKLAEDALEFYTVFQTTYKVWDETLPPSTIAFAGGKVAMMLGPSWRAFEVAERNSELEFRVLPVPQLPEAEEVNWASYWVEGVANGSEHQKEAWEFLKFLSDKESLEKLYENAAKVRLFGEPYSRQEMAGLLVSQPLVGAYVKQAPKAKSWYLASRTWDGASGINSRIIGYFEDAVNAVGEGRKPEEVLVPVAAGVNQVLVQYGVVGGGK